MSMFRFGCGSLPFDPEKHAAGYGARLIYNEVLDGCDGLVYARQTPTGEAKLLEDKIFPVYPEFMEIARDHMEYGSYGVEPKLRFDGNEVFSVQFGDDVVFAASAQGSFGYLYLSAVVLK